MILDATTSAHRGIPVEKSFVDRPTQRCCSQLWLASVAIYDLSNTSRPKNSTSTGPAATPGAVYADRGHIYLTLATWVQATPDVRQRTDDAQVREKHVS